MKKIFDIANKKILIETEYDFEITEKYYDFICDKEHYDIRYKFINTNKYVDLNSKPTYENIDYCIYEENNKIYRVFYRPCEENPYACLIIDKEINNEYICYIYTKNIACNLNISNLFDIMALEYAMIRLNTIILHSSFINYNNEAILFSAPSGTGKSTQADLWKQHKNCEIINGDRTFLNKINGYWMAYGSPYAGSSKIFKNKSISLGNIVLLKQGKENKVYKININEIYRFLIKEIIINYWDIDFYNKAIDLLLDLINDVEIKVLECLPNKEAVDLLDKALKGEKYEYLSVRANDI